MENTQKDLRMNRSMGLARICRIASSSSSSLFSNYPQVISRRHLW